MQPIVQPPELPLPPIGRCDDGNTNRPGAPNEALRVWVTTHGADAVLQRFHDLLAVVFPQGTTFTFDLEVDPDVEDESVVCVATLPLDHPVEPLAYYDEFVARWARLSEPRLSGLFTLLVR